MPNWDSASKFLLGKDAHFIWPSHHLEYFTIHTLKKLLEDIGFKVVYFETERHSKGDGTR